MNNHNKHHIHGERLKIPSPKGEGKLRFLAYLLTRSSVIPCCSECALGAKSTVNTWAYVRNAEFQART